MSVYDLLLKFNQAVWRGQRLLCRVPKQKEVVDNPCTETRLFMHVLLGTGFQLMLNCEGHTMKVALVSFYD